MMITIDRPKSANESTKVVCSDCLKRGRRGGEATFKSTDSNAVWTWEKRHSKHGVR